MAVGKSENKDWFGEVPDEWDITRIGDLYAYRNEKVDDRDFMPLSVTMQGILPQLETAAKSDTHDNRKLVRKGDVVINSRSDRRGSCGISPCDGSVSLINTVLAPRNDTNPRYYDWLFHTVQFADEFYKWGHGIVDDLWTTRWQEMKRILIPVPSLAEQHAIADYLDERCAKIDAIIAESKKSIEEYKELKQAVIYEAVTGGRNKESKKNSNTFYIPEIPTSWNIIPLKRISTKTISYGVIKLFDPDDNGINILRCSDVREGYIDTTNIRTISRTLSEQYKRTILTPGDIVINVRGTLGGCAVIPKSMTGYNIAREVALISPDHDKYNSEFIMYVLLSNIFTYYRDYFLSGAIYLGINMEMLSKFKCPIPSLREQNDIVQYLNDETSKVDSLISEKQSLVNDLEAYKKSLIYEVVTGKRRIN